MKNPPILLTSSKNPSGAMNEVREAICDNLKQYSNKY